MLLDIFIKIQADEKPNEKLIINELVVSSAVQDRKINDKNIPILSKNEESEKRNSGNE